MIETVMPGGVAGSLVAPPSKSHLQRALAIAAFAKGHTLINGYRSSADVDAVMAIIRALGAEVRVNGPQITVVSSGMLPTTPLRIHCGESGLAARMFSAIAALFGHETTITGEGSLMERPFATVADALTQLGKQAQTTHGRLPMTISGSISNNNIEIDGSLSSQVLTGLLIALSMAEHDSTIRVKGLKSKAYAQLTIDTLRQFGITVEHEHLEYFRMQGRQRPVATAIEAEGDWSGAAFLLVSGALAGRVSLTGLQVASSQPDRAIMDVLQEVGAQVEVTESSVTAARGRLDPFTFDATDCPDLFPPLAALAAGSSGQCRIAGVHRLLHKESDRCATILDVLHNAGIEASVQHETMLIAGGTVRSGVLHAHNDHRIAMLGALLALNADGPMTIEGAEAVNKSYPHFFQDLASLRLHKAS